MLLYIPELSFFFFFIIWYFIKDPTQKGMTQQHLNKRDKKSKLYINIFRPISPKKENRWGRNSDDTTRVLLRQQTRRHTSKWEAVNFLRCQRRGSTKAPPLAKLNPKWNRSNDRSTQSSCQRILTTNLRSVKDHNHLDRSKAPTSLRENHHL